MHRITNFVAEGQGGFAEADVDKVMLAAGFI